MLSPQTLERVSFSYRRGYYDGHEGATPDNPLLDPLGEPIIRPFSNYDYDQGYKAGASDKKWYLKRSQDQTPAAGESVNAAEGKR